MGRNNTLAYIVGCRSDYRNNPILGPPEAVNKTFDRVVSTHVEGSAFALTKLKELERVKGFLGESGKVKRSLVFQPKYSVIDIHKSAE